MIKPTFIYSDRYFADLGGHIFPIEKYRLVAGVLIQEGIARAEDLLEPMVLTREDWQLVHTAAYLDELEGKTPRSEMTLLSEMPLNRSIVEAFGLASGGTVQAAFRSLQCGIAVNIGGGYHHAFAAFAEGFCYLNDLAIGIARLMSEGRIERAAVIDCDLHQGNGTAHIFREDPRVFTFSIHDEYNYPLKQKSDWDIGLDPGTRDEEYLQHLRATVPRILDEHLPQMVMYQAGADPYEKDQLGNLKISIDGLYQRDELVLGECARRNIPCAVTLGGGYAFDVRDTVTIHVNTCRAALKVAGLKFGA